MKTIKTIGLFILATSIVACCPCRKQKSGPAESFTGTNWELIQFEGRSFTPQDNYTITFTEEGKINGTGDCNRLMGDYSSTADGTLHIGMLAATRAMCPDQQMENRFVQTLQEVDSYTIDGKLLLLFNNSELKLVFEKVK